MTRLDFYNHFDCSTTIGSKSFVFFVPVEIAGFVVQVWTSAKMASSGGEVDAEAPGVRFSLSIYGPNGVSLVRDERLTSFRWLKLLQKSWQDDIFSKEEVEEILSDLWKIQRAEESH